jgi:MFS family permease
MNATPPLPTSSSSPPQDNKQQIAVETNAIKSTYWTPEQKRGVIFVVLACISELIFSGVLNGWSALYMIFKPQTAQEINRANWIYSIGNIFAIFAFVPQGIMSDNLSNKTLFFSHALIGVVGYGLMVFACWLASLEATFCESTRTWVIFIISQILTSICSNGMHLAIMCFIPTLGKRWNENDKAIQNRVIGILYTVTNGLYSAGPFVVWVVYKLVGVKNWMGLATYSGFTILALIVISVIMYSMWHETEKTATTRPSLRNYTSAIRKLFMRADVIEFTVYQVIYSYFIICFIAMMATRTPWFTEAFSIMMPMIGLVMTFVLSFMTQNMAVWAYSAWINRYGAIAIVGCIWSFLALLYSCLIQQWDVHALWITSTVVFCLLCPIYYSVVPCYQNELCKQEEGSTSASVEGVMRGAILCLTGPALFSISAWLNYGTVEKHGYIAYDTLNIVLTVLVSIIVLLRNMKKWHNEMILAATTATEEESGDDVMEEYSIKNQ